ncbi:MAG: hypothetical protein V3V10_02800, partial [Planctomycetota bacterium]
MPLATDCPECGNEFVLPDHLFGKRIKCKNCAAVFRVGGASAPPEHDDFDSSDAGSQTQIDAPVQEDIGSEILARPGVSNPTEVPGGPDQFATEAPSGPTNFAETVMPASTPTGDETVQDTAQGNFAETWDGDTKQDSQSYDNDAVDGLKPSYDSGDTVADGIMASDEPVTDFPSSAEIPEGIADVTVSDEYADAVADDLADAEAEIDYDAEVNKGNKPKLPGKGSLPGKGTLPGKGSLPGKGVLSGKGTFPGKGGLPGKGALPVKGAGKAALPGKAAGKKTGKLDLA